MTAKKFCKFGKNYSGPTIYKYIIIIIFKKTEKKIHYKLQYK